MMDIVSIRLTPENALLLEDLQDSQPVELNELVNRALRSYFFAERFDRIRAKLSAPTAGQPDFTEDEILNLVS